MNQHYLQLYADFIVKVGVNVRPRQNFIVRCPVTMPDFAHACVRAGYEAGAKTVVVRWEDDKLTRLNMELADEKDLTAMKPYELRSYLDYAEDPDGCCTLAIHAEDPEALTGLDAGKLNRVNLARRNFLKPWQEYTMNDRVQWCVAAVPSRAWAAMVFPGVAEDEAQELLLQRILAAVRVRGDGTAAAAWRAHIARLEEVCGRLNALRLRALRYHNALGTELTVALPEGHFFAGGAERTADGLVFVPNMPTEELFTAPRRDGVNGRAVGSLPLVLDGNVVRGFALTFENGRIVRVEAQQGRELLERAIALDEGAAYLGEAALVPFDSPIAQMGTLFYDTLFDENAACHFAFGNAYPCIEGAEAMDEQQRRARGLNASITHVDFMVGTADLSVTGILPDGGEAPVMRDGVFAL